MAALQLLGYTNVKSMAGGLAAWKAANLPVASGTPPEAKAGKAPEVNPDLFAALDKYFSTLPDGWGTLAPAALNEMLKTSQPFQLDLRETKEIAEAGYIAGATNIPIRTLVKNLDKLPPDKSAGDHCRMRQRSSKRHGDDGAHATGIYQYAQSGGGCCRVDKNRASHIKIVRPIHQGKKKWHTI